MTLREYELRMKAYRMKEVDELNKIHQTAWANNLAGQTKKNGRPVFRRYQQFFDYKKALKMALKEDAPEDSPEFKNFIASFNSQRGG